MEKYTVTNYKQVDNALKNLKKRWKVLITFSGSDTYSIEVHYVSKNKTYTTNMVGEFKTKVILEKKIKEKMNELGFKSSSEDLIDTEELNLEEGKPETVWEVLNSKFTGDINFNENLLESSSIELQSMNKIRSKVGFFRLLIMSKDKKEQIKKIEIEKIRDQRKQKMKRKKNQEINKGLINKDNALNIKSIGSIKFRKESSTHRDQQVFHNSLIFWNNKICESLGEIKLFGDYIWVNTKKAVGSNLLTDGSNATFSIIDINTGKIVLKDFTDLYIDDGEITIEKQGSTSASSVPHSDTTISCNISVRDDIKFSELSKKIDEEILKKIASIEEWVNESDKMEKEKKNNKRSNHRDNWKSSNQEYYERKQREEKNNSFF